MLYDGILNVAKQVFILMEKCCRRRHFKKLFGLRQRKIVGEAGDVPIITIKTRMERLPEIIQGYSPNDILNMDESGLSFKALPDTGLVKTNRKCKGGKKSNSDLL